MNFALLIAGGSGLRMKTESGVPKQFLKVKDKFILIYTLQHFQNHSDIARIYVVCIENYIDILKNEAIIHGFDKIAKITKGGNSAQESIINGLNCAKEDGINYDDIVLIHDGVRPIISEKIISDNIESVKLYGSAITSIPALETVARTKDSITVDSILERSELCTLQSPQSFRFGEILNSNNKSIEQGLCGKFIDQAQLMLHYGYKLNLINGLRTNIKITLPEDLKLLEALVNLENQIEG